MCASLHLERRLGCSWITKMQLSKKDIFSASTKSLWTLESVNVPEYGLRRLTVQRKKKGEGYFTFPCVLCSEALLPGLGEVFPPIPSQNSAIWKKNSAIFPAFRCYVIKSRFGNKKRFFWVISAKKNLYSIHQISCKLVFCWFFLDAIGPTVYLLLTCYLKIIPLLSANSAKAVNNFFHRYIWVFLPNFLLSGNSVQKVGGHLLLARSWDMKISKLLTLLSSTGCCCCIILNSNVEEIQGPLDFENL